MEHVYQARLMEHYRSPRHNGKLECPDFSTGEYIPSCGDKITIEGCISNTLLTSAKFVGFGCVISQASASLLLDLCIGKSSQEILQFNHDTMTALVGIPLGPVRLKCALLPLYVLQNGIKSYHHKQSENAVHHAQSSEGTI